MVFEPRPIPKDTDGNILVDEYRVQSWYKQEIIADTVDRMEQVQVEDGERILNLEVFRNGLDAIKQKRITNLKYIGGFATVLGLLITIVTLI
jgi:hypothetical protein